MDEKDEFLTKTKNYSRKENNLTSIMAITEMELRQLYFQQRKLQTQTVPIVSSTKHLRHSIHFADLLRSKRGNTST